MWGWRVRWSKWRVSPQKKDTSPSYVGNKQIEGCVGVGVTLEHSDWEIKSSPVDPEVGKMLKRTVLAITLAVYGR